MGDPDHRGDPTETVPAILGDGPRRRCARPTAQDVWLAAFAYRTPRLAPGYSSGMTKRVPAGMPKKSRGFMRDVSVNVVAAVLGPILLAFGGIAIGRLTKPQTVVRLDDVRSIAGSIDAISADDGFPGTPTEVHIRGHVKNLPPNEQIKLVINPVGEPSYFVNNQITLLNDAGEFNVTASFGDAGSPVPKDFDVYLAMAPGSSLDSWFSAHESGGLPTTLPPGTIFLAKVTATRTR